MKRTNKLALAVTLALALAGTLATAQPAGGDDDNGGPPQGPGPGRRPPLPKEILDQYDTNHDGTLDATERENLRKDVDAGKVQLPGPGRMGAGGGFRGPNPEALHKMLLNRYDANKNGKLDDDEYIQIGKDVESGKLRLGPPPGARMGGMGMGGFRGPGGPGMGGPGGPGMGWPGMGGPGGPPPGFGGPGMAGPGGPPPGFGNPPNNPPGPPAGGPPGPPQSESPQE